MSSDLETTRWFWDNRAWLAERMRELHAWLWSSRDRSPEPRRVLIIGPGGVGKTTFGRIFTEEYRFLTDAPRLYEESRDVESFDLGERGQIELKVIPGQAHRSEIHWPRYLQQLVQGEFRGVIFFAAYGHQTLGQISYKSHKLYDAAGRNKRRFIPMLLESQRARELDTLNELSPYLSACKKPLWWLTVVTKQDLWWKERAAVQDHYLSGKFEAALRNATLDARGDFRRETVLCSLQIRNLVSSQGELLKQTTAGYDDAEHARSMRHLIETLDSLMRWEGEP